MTNDQKYAAELEFWRNEPEWYLRWYNGQVRELYGVPTPRPEQRVTRHDNTRLNALETWVNADKWRYCKHLFVEPTYFSGKRVLEVGCGPLGLSRFFVGAVMWGLDPLMKSYAEMGYPLNHGVAYTPITDPTTLKHTAEDMPYSDGFFDAVVSVNAIDHVDDFEAAIKECCRVLRPDGELRIEVHYHAATITEPNVINDQRVENAMEVFPSEGRPRCVQRSPSTRFYPPGTHPVTDVFALWSNSAHLYNAVEALR